MKAHVYVTLKREVLDPQGDAIRRALDTLGFEGLRSVRMGKMLELELEREDRQAVEQDIHSMCERLLANPVIEDFDYEIVDE